MEIYKQENHETSRQQSRCDQVAHHHERKMIVSQMIYDIKITIKFIFYEIFVYQIWQGMPIILSKHIFIANEKWEIYSRTNWFLAIFSCFRN